jgi:hypothetical protein
MIIAPANLLDPPGGTAIIAPGRDMSGKGRPAPQRDARTITEC